MRARAVLAGCASAVVLAGCTAGPAPAAGSRPAPVLRVSAIGDSVTEADSVDFGSGRIGAGSWVAHLEGPDVAVVGGWAVSGSTTADMVAGARGIPAADVLVLMGGTNDVRTGVPLATTLADLTTLGEQNEADVVLLCSVVPSSDFLEGTEALNAAFPALARTNGWEYADCAGTVRERDGDWVGGASPDGVHPSRAAATEIGAVVLARLRELVSDGLVSAG